MVPSPVVAAWYRARLSELEVAIRWTSPNLSELTRHSRNSFQYSELTSDNLGAFLAMGDPRPTPGREFPGQPNAGQLSKAISGRECYSRIVPIAGHSSGGQFKRT